MENTTATQTPATIDAAVVTTVTEKPYEGPCSIFARSHVKGQGKFITATPSLADANEIKAVLEADPDYAGAKIVVTPFHPTTILSAKAWVEQRATAKRIAALRAELAALGE